MFINLLIIIIFLIILELNITSKLINFLSLLYSLIIFFFIIIFFILKLDLLAISLFLVYSSVFLIFFLFYNIFNEKIVIKNFNKTIFILIFLIFSINYKFNFNLINYFWINYFKILNFKIIQFTNLMSILIFKLFYLETIFINLYLTIGLVVSFIILTVFTKKYIKNKKLLFWNKTKRIFRRTNSYNSKINK